MQLIDDTADHRKNAAAAPKARQRLLRPAVLMPAVGLALAGALAVSFTGGGGASGDATARPHETATVLLDRLAGTAAKSDVQPVRQDQFVYVKSVGAGAEMEENGASKLDPRGESEVWKSQQVKRIHKIGESYERRELQRTHTNWAGLRRASAAPRTSGWRPCRPTRTSCSRSCTG